MYAIPHGYIKTAKRRADTVSCWTDITHSPNIVQVDARSRRRERDRNRLFVLYSNRRLHTNRVYTNKLGFQSVIPHKDVITGPTELRTWVKHSQQHHDAAVSANAQSCELLTFQIWTDTRTLNLWMTVGKIRKPHSFKIPFTCSSRWINSC